MEHQYSRFKNKNIPYAKVGRRVFESLFNAEKFCSENGLDVNSAIEYEENPDLKNKIQEIAKYQKAILREVLKGLDKQWAFLDGEINGFSSSLENCQPLDREYLKDELKEAIAKHIATYDAMKIMWKVLEELERVTDWDD